MYLLWDKAEGLAAEEFVKYKQTRIWLVQSVAGSWIVLLLLK